MNQAKDHPQYWPIRISCHILNMFAWVFGQQACWIAGNKRFEIWWCHNGLLRKFF